MKRMLMMLAVLIVVSVAAQALPPRPYVGLYADAQHSVMSVNNPGGFFPFTLWIWWLPSERGLYATECAIAYPPNVLASTVTANPYLQVNLGCDEGPMRGTCWVFQSCVTEWIWTHQQICYLTNTLPDFIETGPVCGLSQIMAANCEPGYPVETVTVFNKLALNREAVIAVEPQTWGAIKNLCR